jgi:hypothetical protein
MLKHGKNLELHCLSGMSEIRDRAQAAPVKSRNFRDNGLPVSGKKFRSSNVPWSGKAVSIIGTKNFFPAPLK